MRDEGEEEEKKIKIQEKMYPGWSLFNVTPSSGRQRCSGTRRGSGTQILLPTTPGSERSAPSPWLCIAPKIPSPPQRLGTTGTVPRAGQPWQQR